MAVNRAIDRCFKSNQISNISGNCSIERCFQLNEDSQARIRAEPYQFGYGDFGAAVFYRTYSRKKANGENENWHDVVIRVINGVMSIRKDHFYKNVLPWSEDAMQEFALYMALSMTKMQWTPPGRGLAVCGTNVMYERGVAPLYNCAYTELQLPIRDFTWAMDALMQGVGVGFRLNFLGEVYKPTGDSFVYCIPDTREGWVESVRLLLQAYLAPNKAKPIFDYLDVRGRGEPLKTFGGIASGPEPLAHLHRRIEVYCEFFLAMAENSNQQQLYLQFVEDLLYTDWIFLGDEEYSKIDECLRQHQARLTTGEDRASVRLSYERTIAHLYGQFADKAKVNGVIPRLQQIKEQIIDPIKAHIKPLLDKYEKMQLDNLIPWLKKYHQTTGAEASDIYADCINLCQGFNNHDLNVVRSLLDRGEKMLTYGRTRLMADIANAIGACVVSGGVRRTSEILFCQLHDEEFINLKNMYVNPERSAIMYTSNNSVSLEEKRDFLDIPQLGKLIRNNGEPGFFNQHNVHRFGRVHHYLHPDDPYTREMEEDPATGCNPCGEAMLCSKEVCNLASIYPWRCCAKQLVTKHNILSGRDEEREMMQLNLDHLKAATRYAAFYTQTISLGKTCWPETNAIVAHNRRTGVSMGGIPEIHNVLGSSGFIEMCRHMYRWVSDEQRSCASAAGVPEPLRKTVIKPDGTLSPVVGVSSGMHYPQYRYIIRRVRISKGHPCIEKLQAAGYRYEDDYYSKNTWCFEFPVDFGDLRTAENVKLREQAMLLRRLQSEFADNSVSVTLTFDPDLEGDEVSNVIAELAPDVKTFSMLPACKGGVYKQMPIEGIEKAEYDARIKEITPIDWSNMRDGQAEIPKYCNGDECEIPRNLRRYKNRAASSQ